MGDTRFEWDVQKARQNQLKHGVTFEEAMSTFLDEFALFVADPDHSSDEDRFILMGMSDTGRLLVVCHTYRSDDDVVRMISARRASSRERRNYEEQP